MGFRESVSVGWCYTSVCAGAILVGCSLSACGAPGQGLAERTRVESRQSADADAGSSKVRRLAREYFEKQRNTSRPPRKLPLDGLWRVQDGRIVEQTPGLLRVESEETKAARLFYDFPEPIPASMYNRLRVRMQTDAGYNCHLLWRSHLESTVDDKRRFSAPLITGEAFYSYTLNLDSDELPEWKGFISGICFLPSGMPNNAVVESIELVWEPPDAPHRVSIDNETHEAVPAINRVWEWDVTVPENGEFSVYLGIADLAKAARSDRVRFIATLRGEKQATRPLIDTVLTPKRERQHGRWVPVHADLSAYSGQNVTIELRTEPAERSKENYAYWGGPTVFAREKRPEDTPVILISCDTLRSDHLSCYGYERKTSPNLDAFAQEAVLFENAVSQYVWTLASHMTMLTGQYPETHRANHTTNLAEATVTLAEALSDAGYLTAGFTGHSWLLMPWRGFGHGFDMYNVPGLRVQAFRDIFESHALAEEWLDTHDAGRVFLFLHNYDIHSKFASNQFTFPYEPPRPEYLQFSAALGSPPEFKAHYDGHILTCSDFLAVLSKGEISIEPDEREYLIALYDDCILAVDDALHQLFESLKRRGLYDRALIIVTSDHGEGFGEHGRYVHETVYEECSRVPLLIRFPGGEHGGRRVSDLVQLVDLYPTVLDVLGLPPNPEVEGQSLLPLARGEKQDRPWTHSRHYDVVATRNHEWKLHRRVNTGEHELYRLATDPEEQINLAGERSLPEEPIYAELDSHYRPDPGGWHLLFTGSTEQAEIRVSVSTDARFDGFDLIWGDPGNPPADLYTLTRDGRSLKGLAGLLPKDRDELIVRTADPNARVMLRLSEAESAELHLAGETHTIGEDGIELVLDPQANAYPPPEHPPSTPAPVPTVTLWYEAPNVERSAAHDLPEQAIKELEALGYLK